MNISPYQQSLGASAVSSTSSVTQSFFQNSDLFSGESEQDSLNISSEGKIMSTLISRVRMMDSEEMTSKMEDVKSKIDELNLDELDVDTMSREELEETFSEIYELMESMKPEDAPSRELDIENMSDEELKSMISDTAAKSNEMNQGMQMLGGMAGPPPKPPEESSEVEEELEELNLAELDLESMSRDELEEVATQIHEILEANKPEDLEDTDLDLDDISDEELKNMILGVASGSSEAEKPMGPPPNMMNAGSSYQDMQLMMEESEEDSSELDVVEMLLEALQSDDEDDNSKLKEAVSSFFMEGLAL